MSKRLNFKKQKILLNTYFKRFKFIKIIEYIFFIIFYLDLEDEAALSKSFPKLPNLNLT